MKTLIASLALAFASVTVSVANDNTNTTNPEKPAMKTAVYPSKDAHKINVIIDKNEGATANVRLLSEKGEVLAIQRISKKKTIVHTRFDVTELTDGTYTVEISNGTSKEVKKLSLSTAKQEPVRLIAMK